MNGDWILWENEDFVVKTPRNPHINPEEGYHIIVFTKKKMEKSWDNPKLAGKAFELAAKISKVIVESGIADWTNIQNNQNWGLLPSGKLNFHTHIYGRMKTCRGLLTSRGNGTSARAIGIAGNDNDKEVKDNGIKEKEIQEEQEKVRGRGDDE